MLDGSARWRYLANTVDRSVMRPVATITVIVTVVTGGSVAEWLACWIQAWVQIAAATLSANCSYPSCLSVRQAAKLVAALLRVAGVTAVMAAAYRRVYDSRDLQADCQEPGSAPEPYAR